MSEVPLYAPSSRLWLSRTFIVEGYLAHQKLSPLQDHHRDLDIGLR
jgi:hypothetical protein